MDAALLNALKRQLQLWHRWLGVVLAVPVLLWFLSGAVLLFVPFPRLSEAESRAGRSDLALAAVRIDARQAARAAGLDAPPQRARLGMLGARPVWRLSDGEERWHLVGADDGRVLPELDASAAAAVARDFQRRRGQAESAPQYLGRIERDQWTLNGLSGLRPPLHKLRFADAQATELYVSASTGEAVRDSTRSERGWNWVGAIVHWIYPTALRAQPALWRQVVMWLSGAALFAALAGVAIGAWRSVDAWRRVRRISQYRGVYAWHHWLGWGGGWLMLSWLFSGWMSMGPMRAPPNPALERWRDAFSAPPPAWPAHWRPRLPAGEGWLEAELVWLAGEPWLRMQSRRGGTAWAPALAGAASAPDLAAAVRRAEAYSGLKIAARQRLQTYDAYYLQATHRDPPPLPVWRLRLDDPAASWVQIAPARGDIVAVSDQRSRAERWLYHGLHSWDLPWLLERPRLRLGLLLAGLAIGAALAVTAILVACKRLRALVLARTARRARKLAVVPRRLADAAA